MIKMLVVCSSVLVISACSQGSWDAGNVYDAGYDAGYIKGYTAGHDQEQDPALNRERDTVDGSEHYDVINPDTTGNTLKDTILDLPGVFPNYDSYPMEDSDSVFVREDNYRIYDNSDFLKKQDPAVVLPPGRAEKSGIFTTGLNLYIVIIILLLTLIFLQLMNLRRKSLEIHANTKILKDIAKSQRITKNIDIISNRLTRIESEIIQISESRQAQQLQQLQNKQNIDDPAQEINKLTDEEAVAISDEPGITESNNKPSIFFMPSPDNDGNFDNRRKSDHFIPSESIYQFIMNENSDKAAEFYIYQDPNNMERAINYYSSILEKVCKSENAFDPMGKSIVTLEPGIAVLTGNKWVVKEKALVKYE
jgi:hypothetical protein